MTFLNFLSILLAAALFQFSRASHSGFDVAIKTHNVPDSPDVDTHLALRQSLAEIRKREDRSDAFKGNITLQKSWENAVLLFLANEPDDDDDGSSAFSLPLVEVTCTKCYINGLVTAELEVDPGFNISKALDDTIDEVGNKLENISHAAVEWAADALHSTAENVTSLDFDDFTLPPFNVSLDVDIESIPAASLQFSFEEFELFMQVRTKLAAASTFTIPILKPTVIPEESGVQFEVGVLGVFLTVDLILDFGVSLDLTSGIHIKLDDGMSFKIDLFGNKPSEIAVNGGQFEFLPVTVGVNSATFSAILRVGAHAGLKADKGEFGADFEVAVFADVAKIVTNITATPDDAACKLPMFQEYSFELGANSGAALTLDSSNTFGQVAAKTFTPIWSTARTGMCAYEAETTAVSSATLSSPTLERRDDLETKVAATTITHTGIGCPQTLGPNCPLSLRSTTKYTETRRLTTAVPSGEEATFPVSTYDTVSTEAFGSNVQKVASSSGSPASYIEPIPTSTPSGDSGTDGKKTGSGSHAATCNLVLPLTSSLLALVLISAFAL